MDAFHIIFDDVQFLKRCYYEQLEIKLVEKFKRIPRAFVASPAKGFINYDKAE